MACVEVHRQVNYPLRRPSLFYRRRASDQAIRSYLLTEKFIPSAADAAIRSYRETKQLVEEERRGYTGQELQEGQDVMEAGGIATGSRQPNSMPVPVVSLANSVVNEIANIRVSKDCAIRLVADGPYSKRSIEALVKNLELQLQLGTYDDEPQEDWQKDED